MKSLTVIIVLAVAVVSNAQDGFDFLKLTGSAREAALGGNVVSNADGDVLLSLSNPAILDLIFLCVKTDANDVSIVIPAEGPSLGMAPAGT